MNACFRHKRALALHVTWAHHEWQMRAAFSIIPTDRLAAVMRELSCLQLTLYTLSLPHRGNPSIYEHFSFSPSCSQIQNKVNLTWRGKLKFVWWFLNAESIMGGGWLPSYGGSRSNAGCDRSTLLPSCLFSQLMSDKPSTKKTSLMPVAMQVLWPSPWYPHIPGATPRTVVWTLSGAGRRHLEVLGGRSPVIWSWHAPVDLHNGLSQISPRNAR